MGKTLKTSRNILSLIEYYIVQKESAPKSNSSDLAQTPNFDDEITSQSLEELFGSLSLEKLISLKRNVCLNALKSIDRQIELLGQ